MDEHDEMRLKNKVEDLEKFYISIIKELNKAMRKAKNLGILGVLVGCASLAISVYIVVEILSSE
tara:strand:+ start:662 stop:853 length:192 start_codon:yes stop_codon:yes gene_type:complete